MMPIRHAPGAARADISDGEAREATEDIDMQEMMDGAERAGVWRRAFEASPAAQAVFTPDLDGVVANDAFARLFGTTPAALLGVAFASLAHEDERAAIADDAHRLASGDVDIVYVERRYVRLDGTVFDGRTAVASLDECNGAYRYLLVAIEDVTRDLGASAALAQLAARSIALIENSPDILAVLYPDGEWQASSEGTRLLGYPKGLDVPGGVMSLIHPDDAEAAAVALAEVVEGRRLPDEPIELRLRAADGSYHEFECLGRNLEDDPHVRGVIVTARNVATRNRLQEALHHAEERFRVTFEDAPLVVSIIDLEGRIVDINRAGCNVLGKSRDLLVGSLAEAAVHPDDRGYAIEATQRQLSGEQVAAEFRLLAAGDREIFVLSHASMIEPRDETEQPYIVSLQADITDRKRLEASLRSRATFDALTGLVRRSVLDQALAHALDAHHPLALIFVDLDDLKTINDTFGHEAGDQVLRRSAARLAAALDRRGLAARYGGDEFVILCEHMGAGSEALMLADEIRAAVQQPVDYGDHPIAVTASIGVTVSADGDDRSSILRRADAAAYIAKRSGKARVELLHG